MFFEKRVVGENEGIDNRVADAEDVVFLVLIYTCHLFTFLNRTLRATKMAGKGSPAVTSVKKILAWTFGCWCLLLAHRLIFVIVHWPDPAPEFSAVLSQFWLGTAFDFSTLPILALPIVLFLPLYSLGRPGFNRVLRWLEYAQWAYLCVLNAILVASTYNFTFNSKHLGWEFTAYLKDLGTLAGGISERSPLLLAGWALSVPAIILGGIWILSRLPAAPITDPEDRPSPVRRLAPLGATYLLLIGLLALALRGGFQENPLRAPFFEYDSPERFVYDQPGRAG